MEALETYIKKSTNPHYLGSGYSDPIISVKVKGSKEWAQVYQDTYLWGRAEREKHSTTKQLSPEFQWDSWNVHRFDGGAWTQVEAYLLGLGFKLSLGIGLRLRFGLRRGLQRSHLT